MTRRDVCVERTDPDESSAGRGGARARGRAGRLVPAPGITASRPPPRARGRSSAGAPTVIRIPSPAKGRTSRPLRDGVGGEGGGALARGEPHEVRLAVRDVPALGAQPGEDAVALGDDRLHPHGQLVGDLEGRERRDLRQVVHAERRRGRADRRRDLRVRERVPDAQPGQPVRLGERAEHDDVGVRREQGGALDHVGVADEVDVRLVEHHEHVAGTASRNAVELGGAHGRTGRVVGRARRAPPGCAGRSRPPSPAGRAGRRRPAAPGRRRRPAG